MALMTDILAFVQFPHPGKEGDMRPYVGRVKPWGLADRPHIRSFLRATGDWMEHPGADVRNGAIGFWGEWEGPSRVEEQSRKGEGPRYVHTPVLTPPPASDEAPPQNTDPFVFGDRFRYTFCKQDRNWKLRSLAPGSIVLFGSKLGIGFVLDTVLVVAQWIEHQKTNNRAEVRAAGTDLFERMTVEPMYGHGEARRPRRLYLGATQDQPVNGCFSFVPCLPQSRGTFERPTIDLRGWTSSNLAMGSRVLEASAEELRTLWRSVVEATVEQGLCLGIHIDEPKERA